MWRSILRQVLNIFSHINDFANWLFKEYTIKIPSFSADFTNKDIKWFMTDLFTITPLQILGIGGFTLIIGIWIYKLIKVDIV